MTLLSYGSNPLAVKTLNSLRKSGDRRSTIYEQLSTGLRINRAVDDAGGLGLSTALRAQTRVYTNALGNLNSGIDAFNLAQQGSVVSTSIAIRIQELATQAASGSTSAEQRVALNAEAQELSTEYERIRQTVSYNGQKFLNGSVSSVRLQAGYGLPESINLNVGASGTFSYTITQTVSGSGDGTFSLGLSISPVSSASSTQVIEVTDINGDGNQDIIQSRLSGGADITVILGNGDGTFKAGATYQAPYAPTSDIAIFDSNGDGFKDIVIAPRTSGSVIQIIRGNGDGTFKAPISYAPAGGVPRHIEAGDVNNDGVNDIVSSSSDGRFYVWLGNSGGTYSAPISIAVDTTAALEDIALAHINNDGILDVVVQKMNGVGGDSTFVFLGNGNGTFKYSVSDIANTGTRGGIAIGDLDGDGDNDILSANGEGGAGVSIYLGDNSGALGAENTVSFGSFQMRPLIGDFNGDGKLDFIVADNGNSRFQVYFGNGNGTFKAPITYGTTAIDWYSSAVGDFNNDGITDFIVGSDSVMRIHLGNGTSGSSSSSTTTTTFSAPSISYVNLLTQATAQITIDAVSSTLDAITIEQGNFSAGINRLNVALSNLESLKENLSAASDRISSLDVAESVAELTRTEIIQNAAVALLASANQQPALVLKLISGSE